MSPNQFCKMNKWIIFMIILLQATSKTSNNDLIFMIGDFNGHVGQHPSVFYSVSVCGVMELVTGIL